MINSGNSRRNFLGKIFSLAGVSVLPTSISGAAAEVFEPAIKVEFITHFPRAMTLKEYRQQKGDFENKDKVTTLTSVFKKSGKMISERFSFHGTYSVWTVEFRKKAYYDEWMSLTEETASHMDSAREAAGFRLEIRSIS